MAQIKMFPTEIKPDTCYVVMTFPYSSIAHYDELQNMSGMEDRGISICLSEEEGNSVKIQFLQNRLDGQSSNHLFDRYADVIKSFQQTVARQLIEANQIIIPKPKPI